MTVSLETERLVGGERGSSIENFATNITMVAAIGWEVFALEVVHCRVLVPRTLPAESTSVPAQVTHQIYLGQFLQTFPWKQK